MKLSYLTKRDQKRLRALLLKEDFRRLINDSGKTNNYIIDTVGYTSVPNVTACFESGDVWKVYDTDDRAQVLDECDFSDAYSAYKNAAERQGLSFRSDAEISEAAIRPVLINAESIAELLEGEESGAAAAADAEFLRRVLVYMVFFRTNSYYLGAMFNAYLACVGVGLLETLAIIKLLSFFVQSAGLFQEMKVKEGIKHKRKRI